MLFRSLVVANFLITVGGQATLAPGGCQVCGARMVVGAPEAIWDPPRQAPVACGALQDRGVLGLVPRQFCSILPALIGVCQCTPGNLPPVGPAPAPIAAPVTADTFAPIPLVTPVSMPNGCQVCGAGMVVSAPEAIWDPPGPAPVACGALQDGGVLGLIPQQICAIIPGLISVCECTPGDLPPVSPPQFPTDVPAAPAPIAAPVTADTPAPIPLAVPVPMPTGAPVPSAPFVFRPASGQGNGIGNPGNLISTLNPVPAPTEAPIPVPIMAPTEVPKPTADPMPLPSKMPIGGGKMGGGGRMVGGGGKSTIGMGEMMGGKGGR